MTDNHGPYVIYYAMAAVMVGSSLLAMRLQLAKALKMLLAWVAIFGVAFLIFAVRDNFSG